MATSKKLSQLSALTAGVAPIKDATAEPNKIRSAPGQVMEFALQRDQAVRRAEEAEARMQELESKLQNAQVQGPVLTVSLDQLHEVEGRRRKLTAEQFDELTENLRSNDLITPITVRSRDAGGYEIVSGHNRVAAYRALGRTEIEAVVRSLDEERAVLGAFYANLLQPSLPDYEKYQGFRLIRERRQDLTQEQIAEMAGVSPALLSRLLAFEGLPTEVHELLSARPEMIGAAAAASLAGFAKQGKAAKVIEAVQKLAAEGIDQSAAVAYVSRAEAGPIPTKPKVDVKTFKVGKTPLCSYRRTDTTLRVDFKSAEHAAAVHEEIEQVLERYAASLKKE